MHPAKAFALKVAGDGGRFAAVALAALGDKLGLFAALKTAPADAAELAKRAGIRERYAQEWLLTMASAGYLRLDPDGRYALPPEHAAVLADEGGPLFMGGTLQMLTGMLDALGPLQKAFREGGGVPAGAYPESAWDGMERDMGGIYANSLAREWVPAMPEVHALLQRGCEVADVGCGRGRALVELAKVFPASRYTGFDAYAPNVEEARRRAQAAGVNVRYDVADAIRGLPGKFDVIMALDVLHDAADPVALLRSVRGALREGGRFFSLDPRCAEKAEENRDPLTLIRFGFSVLYCLPSSGGEGMGTLGLTDARMRALCAAAGFHAVREAPAGGSFHRIYECA